MCCCTKLKLLEVVVKKKKRLLGEKGCFWAFVSFREDIVTN